MNTEAASALLHVHIKDLDRARAGREFSQAAVELALGSYPGATLTTVPGDASPYAIFESTTIGQHEVDHVAVHPDGAAVKIDAPKITADRHPEKLGEKVRIMDAHPSSNRDAVPIMRPADGGPTERRALGEIIGARSGDKGPDANVGLWARSDAAYAWLAATITVEVLRELLPEAADLVIDRYELPNLRAINVVIHGILGDGVGGSTRFDPQAKALGELLRSRIVDVPEGLR